MRWSLINQSIRMSKQINLWTKTKYCGKDLAGIELYRLTNEEEYHNGIQYETGLIVDVESYEKHMKYPYSRYPRGLYCFARQDLLLHMAVVKDAKYIRKVTLPEDSRVYIGDAIIRADKFVLGERSVFVAEEYIDEKECASTVGRYGNMLKYVPEGMRSEKVCVTAVKRYYKALEHVPEKMRVCVEAAM